MRRRSRRKSAKTHARIANLGVRSYRVREVASRTRTAHDRQRQQEPGGNRLDRANERLSFYEQFDEIIKQNIVSSSALLREASARFDSDFADERDRYRALLSEILDGLTGCRPKASDSPAGSTTRSTSSKLVCHRPAEPPAASVAPGIAAEAPPEAAAVVNSATTGTRKKPERAKPVPLRPWLMSQPRPRPGVGLAAGRAGGGDPPTGPTSTTLLVHGVPRASAALGLKSYIEKLDFVSTVEPREFAAGLLRLQVDGARPLTLADLSGWTMADRIELKTASNQLLELGLAPA